MPHAADEIQLPASTVEAPTVALVTSDPRWKLTARRADGHPVAVYLARLAPSGRRSQRCALTTIAALLTDGRAGLLEMPWHELRYVHTQAVRTALADRYAPATVNRQLSALRGVLGECWRLGLMTAEDYHRAADLQAVRGSTLPAGRALTAGEIAALFASCGDGNPGDVRDAAVLAVLYAGGLRRAEAVALDVGDYQAEDGRLQVRRGKGRKARTVYLTGGADEAMRGWLAVRGLADGPLFWPIDKAGRLRPARLSGQAIRQLLVRRAGRAGVAAFSPHDLRRTMVGDLLDAGVDIATVQRLAGHASVATTARYDRRPEAAKRQAAGRLHVPYTAPNPIGSGAGMGVPPPIPVGGGTCRNCPKVPVRGTATKERGFGRPDSNDRAGDRMRDNPLPRIFTPAGVGIGPRPWTDVELGPCGPCSGLEL